MIILHESPNNIFWMSLGFSLLDIGKAEKIKIWLKENGVSYHYMDSIGDYDRMMILDDEKAMLFKLTWATGDLP